MAGMTVSSVFTFNIPYDIRDTANGFTARIKRISPDFAGTIASIADGGIIDLVAYITITTSAPHDLVDGDSVNISGCTGLGNDAYNGWFIVSACGASTFNVACIFNATDTGDWTRPASTPVVLEATANINTNDDLVVLQYLSYDDGVTGRQNRRIQSIVQDAVTGKYTVTLQNPAGQGWDAFPTSDTLCQCCAKDNYRTIDDYCSECFYTIQGMSTDNLVFDVEFTKAGTEDLKFEIATYRKEVTKEVVRTSDIFADSEYIDECYDTSGTISKRILTITANGKYRIPLVILLTDQIIRIKVYPSDYDSGAHTGSASTVSLDVRENKGGQRYVINYRTV